MSQAKRFVEREKLRESVYKKLQKEKMSTMAIRKLFKLSTTVARTMTNKMYEDKYITRTVGECTESDRPVYLYSANPDKPYKAKSIYDYEAEFGKKKEKTEMLRGEFGGKILVSKANPNCKTYINLDRDGSDYRYQRRKVKVNVWIGTSMGSLGEASDY